MIREPAVVAPSWLRDSMCVMAVTCNKDDVHESRPVLSDTSQAGVLSASSSGVGLSPSASG
jgi:hypothetical protein